MTNPDYRAICAELVETWDATADFDFKDFGHAAADIVDRARTLLAVTISGLLNPAYEIAGEEIAEGAQLVDGEWWNPVMDCDSLQIVVDYARAANAADRARRSNSQGILDSSPQPVAVSERPLVP